MTSHLGVGLHNIHPQTHTHLPEWQVVYSVDVVARFWAKVEKGEGCWLWTASVTGRGGVKHGQFTVRQGGTQHHLRAHRVAWILTYGAIPDGLNACHHCDVPRCCNPSHLFLGTQADNLADARRKGRLVEGRHLVKLSDTDRMRIRAVYRRGHGRQLAADYAVTLKTILAVVKGTDRVRKPFPSRFQEPSCALDLSDALEQVPSRQLPIAGEVR